MPPRKMQILLVHEFLLDDRVHVSGTLADQRGKGRDRLHAQRDFTRFRQEVPLRIKRTCRAEACIPAEARVRSCFHHVQGIGRPHDRRLRHKERIVRPAVS